ncbi:MAG TPA: RdgB/HAM1 family non-canonical purine NTP pyrophosphatase [Thermoflexia bacterium]|nr:RdgB/HAM1 family non-canonical purine NTP pyrophosphatase [Thermoflexia bacterium]
MKLLLATHNHGKRREWQALLAGLDVELLLPEDLGLETEVAETGATYQANALLKARTLSAAAGLPALADDSGLEVDALDGAPGIRSARYRLGSDEIRYRALLQALQGVPASERTARFRCLAAVVCLDGREFTTEGVCEGVIATTPAGEEGFGYDPVFYVPEAECTLAEFTPEQKNQLSHRARAAQEMREILQRLAVSS